MNTNQLRVCTLIALALWMRLCPATATVAAEKALPMATFAKLPITELTVFKDGHAFVAHDGQMPTDDKGNVVMDYLPAPVIGTFWPYSAEKKARLAGVVASQKRVVVERTALDLRELIEANTGTEAIVWETGASHYDATIVGFPARSTEELAATSPPNTPGCRTRMCSRWSCRFRRRRSCGAIWAATRSANWRGCSPPQR
jgi:hypothetical protein